MESPTQPIIQWRMALLFALCCLFWCILGALVFLIVGKPGIGAFFGWLVGMAYWLVGCWASERFVLDLYRAEPLTPEVAPNLIEMVQELCISAAVERPMLYSVAYAAPNALAVARPGRDPVIIVTNGLTQKLHHDEVRAVVALMLARLADPDAAAWSVATTLAGLPLYGAASATWRDRFTQRMAVDDRTGMTVLDRFVLTVLVPPCAAVLRLVFDGRNYAAVDRQAAALAGDPAALASALAKIGAEVPHTWWGGSTYNPATALLFAVPPVSDAAALEADTSPLCLRAQEAFSRIVPPTAERERELLATG